LHPERFRCGIALDAPIDIPATLAGASAWRGHAVSPTTPRYEWNLYGIKPEQLERMSAAAESQAIKSPVMILQADDNVMFGGREFVRAIQPQNPDSVFVSLSANEAAPQPKAQAAAFERMRGFLNANVYRYAVNVGALRVQDPEDTSAKSPLKSDAPAPR
jgi:dipeptidyl aminopeptidase/acylaminoacyl peptidase